VQMGDNIRMNLGKISWEVVDWFHVAQKKYRCRVLVNTVMNFRIS
jgi:hypothetical protein